MWLCMLEDGHDVRPPAARRLGQVTGPVVQLFMTSLPEMKQQSVDHTRFLHSDYFLKCVNLSRPAPNAETTEAKQNL